MRILIIGASGNVGGHTVDHAPKSGHGVSAGARDPSKVQGDDPKLRKVEAGVPTGNGATLWGLA